MSTPFRGGVGSLSPAPTVPPAPTTSLAPSLVPALILLVGLVIPPALAHDPPPLLPAPTSPHTAARPHHSFRMGFNPFFPTWSDDPVELQAIVAATYAQAQAHGDMIAHLFPDGVPWVEMAAGLPLSPEVEASLQIRTDYTDGPAYLGFSPLNSLRDGVAEYWGSADLPPEWEDPSFDDPLVISTYVTWCRYLIDRFEPDVVAFAIEPNMIALKDKAPEQYPALRRLLERTYQALKASHPDVPVCVTLQIDYLVLEPDTQWLVMKDLLHYSDLVAVSTYPWFIPVLVGAIQPGQFPDDWFSRVAELAPHKPFMVAETGGAAEPLALPSLGLFVDANVQEQTAWVEFLLKKAAELNTKWVVWIALQDFDGYLAAITDVPPETLDILSIFKDVGLVDEHSQARPGLAVWDDWLRANEVLEASAGPLLLKPPPP